MISNNQSLVSQILKVLYFLEEAWFFQFLGISYLKGFWSWNLKNQVLLNQSFETTPTQEKSD